MSEKTTRAGPPKCVYCGELMEGWTRKWVDDDSLLWLCPNYCSFKDITVPIKHSEGVGILGMPTHTKKSEFFCENRICDDIIDINNQTCPECGESGYRVIFTNDSMSEVKFFDCMHCHTHWDKNGVNLGKH